MRRRDFLRGAIAASVAYRLVPAWAHAGAPLLRFGAASDVHMRRRHPLFPWVRGSEDNDVYLEKALRWFDRMLVDAVVFPGDLADLGLIPQLEQFADTWNRVFPKCRAADGRPVARIAVTGNHDIGQWPSLWKRVSEEDQRKWRFDHPDNLAQTWRRLFDEDWQLVSRHDVKGVSFICAQYMALHPPVEKYFNEHGAELDPNKPFFFVQHAHPSGTCFSDSKRGMWDHDMRGETTRTLSRFPNAVALSGHTHNSVVDDRSVWQGAFTSINCGCTWGAGLVYYDRDNALAPFFGDYKHQRMASLVPLENAGRCCLAFDVFADHLVIHRWCVQTDEPVGEDRVVPLPAATGGPFDYAEAVRRRREAKFGPQFGDGAAITVERCAESPKNIGPKLKGKSVVRVTFPAARSVHGVRVFDYIVRVLCDGREVVKSVVLAPGFFLPERLACISGEALFAAEELPVDKAVLVSVTPRDCYGVEGETLTSTSVHARGWHKLRDARPQHC